VNKRQRRPKGQSKTLEKTEGAIKNGKSRETANIEYRRHRANKR